MQNSNTLPNIEVGDTVIFRTDLKVGKQYGIAFFLKNMRLKRGVVLLVSENGLFRISHENKYWYTPEMVAQVIRPTVKRVYTEQEMKQCWEKAFIEGLYWNDEDFTPGFFKDFIESLNK